jgi:hypothetical protein
MKNLKLLLAVPLLMSVSACATVGGDGFQFGWPKEQAEKTILDEKIAVDAELIFKASIQLTNAAIDMKLLETPDSQARAKLILQKMHSAVKVIRLAYKTGNNESYVDAWNQLLNLKAEMKVLIDIQDHSA